MAEAEQVLTVEQRTDHFLAALHEMLSDVQGWETEIEGELKVRLNGQEVANLVHFATRGAELLAGIVANVFCADAVVRFQKPPRIEPCELRLVRIEPAEIEG